MFEKKMTWKDDFFYILKLFENFECFFESIKYLSRILEIDNSLNKQKYGIFFMKTGPGVQEEI